MDHRAPFPPDFHLLLASQSPRRHSLLRDVGVPFTVVPSEVDEVLTGGDPAGLAEKNALAKVRGASVPARLSAGAFVLGADTVVVSADGVVMGKPASADEAIGMLRLLSGRAHQVVSGVAITLTGEEGPSVDPAATVDPPVAAEPARTVVASAVTDVTFMSLTDALIEAYIASNEWRDKAGAYAIQGLAGLFVTEVRGEYTNVVGLPLHLVARLFREAGFDLVRREWVQGGCRRETNVPPSQQV